MQNKKYRYGLTTEKGTVKQHGKIIKRFRGEHAANTAEQYAQAIETKLKNL